MLKTDLHLHAGEDIHHKLKYSSKKLIDYAASKGFNVLSLTFHEHVYFNKKIPNSYWFAQINQIKHQIFTQKQFDFFSQFIWRNHRMDWICYSCLEPSSA